MTVWEGEFENLGRGRHPAEEGPGHVGDDGGAVGIIEHRMDVRSCAARRSGAGHAGGLGDTQGGVKMKHASGAAN